MNSSDNRLNYIKERTSRVPCCNIYCRFFNTTYEQNCKASYNDNDIPYFYECDKYYPTHKILDTK